MLDRKPVNAHQGGLLKHSRRGEGWEEKKPGPEVESVMEPQFKIHGQERRDLKKKLSLLRKGLGCFQHHWQINDDLYRAYGHENPISPDGAQEIYDKDAKEIEALEELLAVPYGI